VAAFASPEHPPPLVCLHWRMKLFACLSLFLTALAAPLAAATAPSASLYDLSCEHETAPLGLETLAPRFSWKTLSERHNFIQGAYRILVASSPEKLTATDGDVWDSGKVASRQSVLVPFAGKTLAPVRVYFWKVQTWDAADNTLPWSKIQQFTTGLFSENSEKNWSGAAWLALEKDNEKERIVPGLSGKGNVSEGRKLRTAPHYKMPQFRKTFDVKKPLKRATAFVAGLGHFDFFLNGKKVGDRFLDAGWTKFDKQALYVTFDVTQELRTGANAAGIMLGGGFYDTPAERYLKVLISHGAPKMKLLLQLEYADGEIAKIISDETWKTTQSAITFSSIYGGEDFDATHEQINWKNANFDDSKWQSALRVNYEGKLTSMRATPLAVHSELPTVKIFKNSKGFWIYDLGQNASGIIQIVVKAKSPTPTKKIVFRPGELLRQDNTVSQSGSGAPYYFSYVPRATGSDEVWQPQFTYYGFRYIQVEGAVPAGKDNPESLPEVVALKGLHTCNAAAEAGSFVSSKEIFNKTHKLIDWALRSNMASVLTDCPHREKLGWLEQAHLMQFSILYRYNLARLYGKIMNDMELSQLSNGCIPTIAPEYVRFANGFEDTPEWGSAFIISPFYHYQFYGDKQLLETYYPAMQRYLDYLTSRAKNNIVAYGLGDWFDIGPRRPGYAQLTSNGVTATAIYYYNTTIMSKTATLLNKPADAARYDALAAKIKSAFNKKFYNETTGKIERDSQTANAIALYVGLVEEKNKSRILDNLVNDIRRRKNALTAGDVGYRYVLRALEQNGRSDVIFDMNARDDVPGYGWMLRRGATALTESWQAYPWVSNNHFMLGHLMEWFYSGIGGIRQKENSVAFQEIIIDPQIPGDVSFAKTTYKSPYGTIRCEWKKNQNNNSKNSAKIANQNSEITPFQTYTLKVSIPPNTTAEIALPPKQKDQPKRWQKVTSGDYEF
jgi:hypothetical protein